MPQARVLIVDDQRNMRTTTALVLAQSGYEVAEAESGDAALERLLVEPFDVVLTDLRMAPTTGLDVLRRALDIAPTTQVIVMTGYGTIESAVEAMQLGAHDYIAKPFKEGELLLRVQRALEKRRLLVDVTHFSDDFKKRYQLDALVGRSAPMRDLLTKIVRVAPTDATVLITGESGTGKELIARAIHANSKRSNRPFVPVNCAAISEQLLESELFGHVKGAFTGALERRAGCFELAEEGTIFLDEIGEMPIGTQAKLLRLLEDRKLRRLGSKVETTVDVRVLAATNKAPEEAVAKGQLRNDLYYRLNVFNIDMPALREHKEDLPELTQSLLEAMNEKHGRKVAAVSDAVMSTFQAYDWPGNVRELRNLLERAVIVCESAMVEPKHLPPGFGHAPVRSTASEGNTVRVGVGTTVEDAERMLILKTLESTHNNKTRAADILGISLKTLHNKLKEYGGASVGAAADSSN